MWFEVLPSVGVIFTAMTLGGAAVGWIPNLILGKPTMRFLIENHDHYDYLRDQRLTGSAYKMQGLEGIPDESESEKKK